nr:MerC domain-containing protein [Mizugakiibacter sediminis]
MNSAPEASRPALPWWRHADRVGVTASLLCALHCAALPFVLALLPAFGLGFLAGHGFERGFVVFACTLAALTMWNGYRRHRSGRAFVLLLPGAALLLAGLAVDLGRAPAWHAALIAGGGVLVALAHVANLRLTQLHAHDARCGCVPQT